MIDQQPVYIHSTDSMYLLSSSISPYINDLSCNRITIQSAQNVGSANMTSSPSGADIYIDDTKTNATTPATINISNDSSAPQVHTYKIVKPGYTEVNGTLLITPGQTFYNTLVTLFKTPGCDTLPLILGIAFVGSLIMMIENQRKKDIKRSELLSKDKLKLKRLEQERSELLSKDKLKLKRLEQERSALLSKDKLKLQRLEQERSALLSKDKLKLQI